MRAQKMFEFLSTTPTPQKVVERGIIGTGLGTIEATCKHLGAQDRGSTRIQDLGVQNPGHH